MDIRIYAGPHKTASRHLASVLTNNKGFLDAEEILFCANPNTALRHINAALKAIADGGDKIDVTDEMLYALTDGIGSNSDKQLRR